jgi:SAM-dependent methyltransferase
MDGEIYKIEETILCPICNSVTELLYKNNYFFDNNFKAGYVQVINLCPNCGFVFCKNGFSHSDLKERYDKKSNYEFSTTLKYTSAYKKNVFDSQRQYKYISENCCNFSEVKSVFEVGAASGYNLNLYKQSGMEVYGVEPSKINVKSAKDDYNIDMYYGFIEDFPKDKQYDMILFSHVLEHLVNPIEVVKACRNIANRYVFIEVPCLENKCIDMPYGFFYSEHMSYFTKDSLTNLMKFCGFRLVNFRFYVANEYYSPAGSPCLLTIWEKDKLPKKNMVFEYDKNIIRSYMDVSSIALKRVRKKIEEIPTNKKLAVYGANENTARLLAYTNLKYKNIVCFYDGDKNKQGKFIDGIPIRACNALDIETNGIECILISSYVSRNDIYKSIMAIGINIEIIVIYEGIS